MSVFKHHTAHLANAFNTRPAYQLNLHKYSLWQGEKVKHKCMKYTGEWNPQPAFIHTTGDIASHCLFFSWSW